MLAVSFLNFEGLSCGGVLRHDHRSRYGILCVDWLVVAGFEANRQMPSAVRLPC